jgi:hypothetical protein
MPLYLFRMSHQPPTDVVVELADDEAAWSLAVTSTGEVLRDLDGEMNDRHEIVATVHDETGRLVATLRISGERGESLKARS